MTEHRSLQLLGTMLVLSVAVWWNGSRKKGKHHTHTFLTTPTTPSFSFPRPLTFLFSSLAPPVPTYFLSFLSLPLSPSVCPFQTLQLSGLTVRPPVWDTIPRSPGFTSNSHGELIQTLVPNLGYIIYGSTYSGEDKTQAALRAQGLASLD